MLRALLLDSGDTLMHPRGGRWNPRFDFEQVVRAEHPHLVRIDFGSAISAGDEFLRQTDWHGGDYKKLRAEYHRLMLGALGVTEPSAELIEALDRPMPFSDLVEPFDDVAGGLAALRADGWRMAIVADTSANMVDVYREHALDDYFEVFAISEVVGASKPDVRMFRTASDAMGLAPSECLFVDDNLDNLLGAIGHGYEAWGISRYADPPNDGLHWVRNLDELRSSLRNRPPSRV